MFDILAAGRRHARDDYLVYTNVDIHPVPGLFQILAGFAELDVDGVLVNRRTVENFPPDVPSGLAAASIGIRHDGFDCFAFTTREALNVFAAASHCQRRRLDEFWRNHPEH